MIVVINNLTTVDLTAGSSLRCGRLEDTSGGLIGLDPHDRSISRRALVIEHIGDSWALTNTSTTQRLFVDRSLGGPLSALPPGARHLIDRQTAAVEVRGSIRTHRIEFFEQEDHLQAPSPDGNSMAPDWMHRTLTDSIVITEHERVALVALYRGYLEKFPRRECEPLTYAAAADLLGISAVAVRRRVERVRARLRREGVFLEGLLAKHQLALYLLDHQVLGPGDLALLEPE